MLVITRREGEEVVIGDPHKPIGIVRVAGIRGDRVRIAFEFPREIQVHRREVADQIKVEGRSPIVGKIGRPEDGAAEPQAEPEPEPQTDAGETGGGTGGGAC